MENVRPFLYFEYPVAHYRILYAEMKMEWAREVSFNIICELYIKGTCICVHIHVQKSVSNALICRTF